MHFYLLPFRPIVASIIGISFILSTLQVYYYMHTILLRLMGISAQKPVLLENSRRNRPTKTSWKITQKNISEFEKTTLRDSFLFKLNFNWNQPIAKLRFRKYCIRFEILTKSVFRLFLIEFSVCCKRYSARGRISAGLAE